MPDKRKQLRLIALALLAGALGLGGSARAGEVSTVSNPPMVETRPIDAAGDVVAKALRALHDRNTTAAFVLLTEQQQTGFQHDATLYLKSLRLNQHALYDHNTFRVLDTEHQGNVAIHKVELIARDGHTALAIFRLLQQGNGVWRIDRIGIVDAADERDA